METTSTFKEDFLKIPHLPTICLLIGYLFYWVELYFLNNRTGRTTPLAFLLFLAILIISLIKQRRSIHALTDNFRKTWNRQDRPVKNFVVINGIAVSAIIIIVLYASLLPPHLIQEFDALNYHLTIPRQHLISGSFQHLTWSSADLFPLPIDFALAPYWFATELPNKIPQFIFLIGLVLVSINLVKRFSSANFASIWLTIFAIISLHCLAIQMGTAMLDIVICYLFIAGLDSFLEGNIFIAAVEFTFFLWAKSFMPLQVLFIITAIWLIWLISKYFGFKDTKLGFGEVIDLQDRQQYGRNFKKLLVSVIALSILVGGPFLIKSTYYSGTPLFPFAPGLINTNNIDKNSTGWNSMLASSKTHLNVKDKYGYPRTLPDFVQSLWLIAVPEKGVNNRFDYPAGLTYLLFLGPFIYMLFCSLRKKQFPILPLIVVIFGLSWWAGSQQTRFLYIPIILMIIAVASEVKSLSVVFMAAISISMALTGISLFRAHRSDFGKSRLEVLRLKDKELIKANESYFAERKPDSVSLGYFDAAYARFPVFVTKPDSFWVLNPGNQGRQSQK